MTSDFDVSQYMGLFLDEAEEQLQILDESIVVLEHDKENMDLLNKIFRAAHTLKGSSASMGFDNIAHLTHAMESVLDRLRHRDLAVTTEIADLLLESLDNLRILVNQVANGQDDELDITELVDKLKKVAQGKAVEVPNKSSEQVAATAEPKVTEQVKDTSSKVTQSPTSTYTLDDVEMNVIQAAYLKGFNVWHIVVKLVPDCLMKAARAYIVFNNLKDAGEVVKTIPSVQDIEEEKFQDTFEIFLVSQEDAYVINDIIKSISEIDQVTIEPVNIDKSSTTQPANKIPDTEQKIQTKTEEPEKTVKTEVKTTADKHAAPIKSQTVRVDVQRLENLMNLVGELVIDRTRLLDVGGGLKNKLGSGELVETLEEVSAHIGRITTDLQEEIMKARMFPIEQVFNRFPRMVRDLAQKAHKEVDFIVEGKETELDRTVIEEIGDPLIHLLRNAIDHGIESPEERVAAGKPRQGTVHLRAFHQENQIVITVEDDGRGMSPDKIRQTAVEKGIISAEAAARLSDREAINLIFYAGFSTAKVISDISGRGVGMDIVRSHIEKINGIIDIDSVYGKGTRFTIKLPLTLAINRSLLVYLGERVFAFPLSSVVEIINVERKDIQRVQRREVVMLRGEVLPILKLHELLGIPSESEGAEKFPVVVCGISEKRIGFVVDSLLGEQEIVIKSLGDYIGQVPGLAGATIMGDGRVALILDVRGLVGQTGAEASGYAS